jgi:hypothetical protein
MRLDIIFQKMSREKVGHFVTPQYIVFFEVINNLISGDGFPPLQSPYVFKQQLLTDVTT